MAQFVVINKQLTKVASNFNSGYMSKEDKSKLDGIEAGAEVNIIETINVNGSPLTPVAKAVDITMPLVIDNLTSTSTANALSANQGKVLKGLVDSVSTGMFPQGDWDADTNTPDISVTTTSGFFWYVTVAGSTDLDGITDWKVNDIAIKNRYRLA